jgi:protein-tyrosine phosphatase
VLPDTRAARSGEGRRGLVTPGPGVDLHVHILPGVDDGPATPDESLALGRMLGADGTHWAVATPHVRELDTQSIRGRVRELQLLFERERVPVTLMPGGEVDLASAAELDPAALESIAQGPPGRRWILLEAPLGATPARATVESAAALRARGFASVIAHPERSPALMGDRAAALRRLVQTGCRVQVSASSLLGGHGGAARRAGWALLRSGLTHAVASDAHSRARPPRLAEAAAAAAAEGLSPALVRHVFSEAPLELVQTGVSSAGACTAGAGGSAPSTAPPSASANRA